MKKLIEQLFQGTYYYSKFSLNIESRVINVMQMNDELLYVSFKGGCVSVSIKMLKKVYAPSNNVRGVFKWCYEIRNHTDVIGYVGLKEGAEL